MKLDNKHIDFSAIDGRNKPINLIVSEREAGKTTFFHVIKAKPAFLAGRPTICVRRQQVDITDAYVYSLLSIQNKFLGEDEKPFKFFWKKGDAAQGFLKVYLDEDQTQLAYVVVALSTPMSRLKSLFIPNPAFMLTDEFICNTRLGEKYLKDEAMKWKEIYTTFYRESSSAMKAYFLGNPYSLYNPYFVSFGINPKELVKNHFVVNESVAAQFHDLKPELKEWILSRNPLYQFEDAYTRYALEGQAINDENIKIVDKLPPNYRMDFVFYVDGKYIAVYANNDYTDFENRFYVGFVNNVGARQSVYCFDFKDLIARSSLISRNDRDRFSRFKRAVNARAVAFQSLECDYLVEETYTEL